MPEEDKKEEKKGAAVFSVKKYWKIQVFLLLIFLLGFGFLAYFLLGKQAHKLVGTDSYSELSRNSYGENKSLVKKLIAYFSSEEKTLTEERPDGFSFDNSSIASSQASENSKTSSSVSQESVPGAVYQGGASSMSSSKLSSSLGSSLASASLGKSKTELSNFTEGGKNKAVGTTPADKANFSKGAYAQKKVSALDALKGAWKASLYGARLSSQDAAKSWTAKAFDSSPEAEMSLKYDEKMKSKLDRLNPNAIPQYLKDQNIEMEAMDSAKPSDVPDFTEDNGKKEKELNAEKEMKEKLAQQFAGGMFNSMYGNPSSNDKDEESAASSLGIEEPESRAQLGPTVTTDEFGYIRVTGDDGMIQIFDPDSGAILGCEVPDAGMCVMPGAEGCPSGMYFV